MCGCWRLRWRRRGSRSGASTSCLRRSAPRCCGGGTTPRSRLRPPPSRRGWNAPAQPMAPATLPQVFEAQVARSPDAVALVFGDATLSYGALDARANRLAHHLRGWGVGPESVVGLCVERSLAMLVGLLGILKAGGAYLPLDPDY